MDDYTRNESSRKRKVRNNGHLLNQRSSYKLRSGRRNNYATSTDTDDNSPGAKYIKTDRIKRYRRRKKKNTSRNDKSSVIGVSETDEDVVKVTKNEKALKKEATTYELEKFEKRALIIFNQVEINGYTPRVGTEKDVDALMTTFQKIGFDAVEHRNKTKKQIMDILKRFSNRDFTDYGCVVVVVLTHGSNHGLLMAKDEEYSEIEIINYFKASEKPTLVTKPKIIIVQACRGKINRPGVSVPGSSRVRKDNEENWDPYILPSESDILILHSSYIGSPAHRDELHGSWLIQSLCKKIDELAATHDLESIITEVKREVAIDKCHEEYNMRTLKMDKNKQMPVTTSTLIRKLHLRKYDATIETSCPSSEDSDHSISIIDCDTNTDNRYESEVIDLSVIFK